MDPKKLIGLIRGGESDFLELKREWWDFETKVGKATFAKDVLAMANALSADNSIGFIVLGVEDPKVGGAVVGIAKSPSQETIGQTLGSYTNPVPKVRLIECEMDSKKLGVLEVSWDQSHPYYSNRDVESILSRDVVYMRRSGMVTRLKPFEFERLIRAKDVRLGTMGDVFPLSVGFVELPIHSTDKVAFRIANATEERIANISAAVDVVWQGPEVAGDDLCRMRVLNDLTLGPGETREAEIYLSNASFWDSTRGSSIKPGMSSWFEIRLRVRFRSRDGYLQEIVRVASTW